MILRIGVCLVVLVQLSSCGSKVPPVTLSGEWPQTAGDYEKVSEAWTRRGEIIGDFSNGFDRVLDVRATFQSPEWRTAYVAHRAKLELMPANKRAKLLAEQRATDEKYYEVTLLVTTYSFRENDLQKGKRSIWRLALVDSKGNESEPIEVESVRTPQKFLKPYYPQLRPQDEVYVARFAKEGLSIFDDGAKQLSFKMAGARGGVELLWKTK